MIQLEGELITFIVKPNMNYIKSTTVLILFICSVLNLHAQPEGRKWGGFKFFKSPGAERGQKIQTDNYGNIYVGGECAVPFSIEGDTLKPNGHINNQFIIKYDRSGTKQWFKRLSSNNFSRITAIEVDAQENVYITGSFRDTLRFDQFVISSSVAFGQPGFVAKINKQGIVQWLIRIGNGATSNAASAKLTSTGNLIVAGNFSGISNTFGTFNLSTLGNTTNLYVASISPQGVFNWVTYSKGNFNELFDLALDKNDNVFICGAHASNITLDGQNYIIGIQHGTHDGYLIKLNSIGSMLWAKGMGSTSSDMAKKLATDKNGNCFVYGYWGHNGSQSQIVFDSTHIITKTPGKSYSFFIAKYNSDGNVNWAQKFDEFSPSGDLPHIIRTDENGNCYLSGHFTGVWFGQNIQDTILKSGPYAPYEEIAIQQFLPGGQRGWNVIAGNVDYATYERVEDLLIDKQGNFYMVAIHGGFDSLRIGDTVVDNETFTNVFIAKLGYDKQRVEPNQANVQQACAGDSVSFPFSINDTFFNINNVFTLQLSNNAGLFNNPINLATKNTNQSDTFLVQLPITLAQGNGYRYRIIASNPTFTSFDNGQDFTVYALPLVPTIIKNDTTLTCNPISTSYQWYRNDSAIIGATNQILHVSENGTYKVKVTNANGCSRLSDTITVIKLSPVGLTENDFASQVKLFPNPVSSTLFIQGLNVDKPICFDLLGKQVFISFTKTSEGFVADMSTLSDGVYMLKFQLNGQEWFEKITVVK